MTTVDDATSGCGCCAGVHDATPREVTNRPGLPAVSYRAGAWADFRASLHAALHSSKRPALSNLRTREDDDFTLALLDGFATVCDIITFYTERLAQESYLRTAVDRTSLRELGRLVAYRLNPGVAAATHLAFFVEPPTAPLTPPAPPSLPAAANQQAAAAAFPPPGTRSAEVLIEAGLPVRSVPGPGEAPQTFETVEPVVARPEWNALRPTRTKAATLVDSAYLEGTGYNLKVGDRLLFSTGDGAEMRPLTAMHVDAAAGTTYVTWQFDLTYEFAQADVSVFRTRAPVFGHAAPRRDLLPATAAPSADIDGDWSGMVISPDDNAVDVEGSHPEIRVGDPVALIAFDGLDWIDGFFTVSGVQEMSRAAYGVSGAITRIWLTGGDNYGSFQHLVRSTIVFAAPEPLTLAGKPDHGNVLGGQIDVEGAVPVTAAGRTLLLTGMSDVTGGWRVEVARLKSVTSLSDDPPRSRLVLDGDLSDWYVRKTVVVYGNVAAATHGETVHQILGNGEAVRPHQAFDLQHAPLTYIPATTTEGGASTLAVRVNDVLWHERPTLYGADPADRAFVTRDTERGTVAVQFGDGARGARLPTGSHNVRAVYRKGVGAAGNVAEGVLSQLLDPPYGVTKVTNPAAATGGADPQSEAAARACIPLPVRTLGRAVSLLDYADYAAAFVGVAKASAVVLPLRTGRTIVVTVAGPGGQTLPDDARARLLGSLRDHGDPLAAISVVPHRPATFRLAFKVFRDPDYAADAVKAAVTDALNAAFAPDAREFAQPVYRSELVTAVQTVPGVVAVDLDLFYRLTPPYNDPLGDRMLAAQAGVADNGTALGAELLAIDDDPFGWFLDEEVDQ